MQFNAAKTMGKLIPHVDGMCPSCLLAHPCIAICCLIDRWRVFVPFLSDATLGSVIKPSLEELLSHGDVDVEFFAAQALAVAA